MKGAQTMKQYYKVINTSNHSIEYWKGDTSNSSWLLSTGNFIIPLGTHKPKNITSLEIKIF